MLSDRPLPDMSYKEALDTFVRLYKIYVNQAVSGPALRVEIERMSDAVDIEGMILDIGKAMQQAELGNNFNLRTTTHHAAILQAGTDVLENFYFSRVKIDDVISHAFNMQNNADDLRTKSLIGQAMMQADARAYRRACDVPAYREIARPILDILFSPTGAQAPRLRERLPENTPSNPAMEM